MSAQYFIALDTHCQFTEIAIISQSGKVLVRNRCETTIPAIVKLLEQVRRPRSLTFEEGPLADWLSRSLRPFVDRLIVCEPRRNALIAKEGVKDDAIDAERLANFCGADTSRRFIRRIRSIARSSSNMSHFTMTGSANESGKDIN
jgi:hypothetical protein